MPPRLRPRVRTARILLSSTTPALQRCSYAAIATATTPAPPIEQAMHGMPQIQRYPATQPPSHKPPEFRKSQLHRQYTSLLRSSPLILFFQHNNLKANEWMAIRRELAHALRQADAEIQKAAGPNQAVLPQADSIKIQIIQTGIFGAALKVVEFYHPEEERPQYDRSSPSATAAAATIPTPADPPLTHALSSAAHAAATSPRSSKLRHGLEPLLSGPLALVAFPAVSPAHLKAVLSTLAPGAGFAAPKRRARPAYHDPAVQAGVAKLMMLAARVEGRVLDQEGVRWVGGIEGGVDGLRAQLVSVLQGIGAGVVGALEGAGRSLYFAMEARKGQLQEEKEKGGSGGAEVSS